ncbi:uncharacterized protein LOC121071025 isoform X1 [Cygnus olor]|uniref:uncharacterized protein LOC121071025 isoform X1 n=1 Tax=Cygnus olor TaxID=8869 RepID=UPI001ADDFF66|nr:uncharacterized protein LOC121071025 isoform X1 [Cygnus olor]
MDVSQHVPLLQRRLVLSWAVLGNGGGQGGGDWGTPGWLGTVWLLAQSYFPSCGHGAPKLLVLAVGPNSHHPLGSPLTVTPPPYCLPSSPATTALSPATQPTNSNMPVPCHHCCHRVKDHHGIAREKTLPACSSWSAAVTSEVAEPELEAEAEDVECPLEDETNALNITDPQSIRTFRYIIVRRCQNFHTAQRVCSRCYRGRLASIHSYRTNILLQCRARTRVNNGRVWIGAITVLWAAACSATGLTTAAGTTRTGCTATRWSRGASAPPSAPQMGAGGAQTAT